MNDVPNDLSSRPGRILKAAREEEGLSLAQVAEELHLRSSVVDAMEREDFSEFSSPIFLKGYFRSYCRLVNLHEERMLDLLEAQLSVYYGAMDEAKSAELKVAHKQSRQRTLKKLALILLLLAIPLAFFLFFYDLNDVAPPESSVLPAPDEQHASVQDSDPQPQLQDEFMYSGQVDDDSGDVVSPEYVAEDQDVIDVEPLPVVADETAEAVPASDHTGNEEIKTLSLEFSFSGDCWVNVTDGTGRVVAAVLKRSGDTLSISSSAPYSLVLGNARVVSLTVDNEPYDLLKHTSKNGRAAFVLE